MKLRLGLLNRDLAHRLSISEDLCSNISQRWLDAMVFYFQSFIYMPEIGKINVTFSCFHQYQNLIGIIDFSEVFIETPKDLKLKSAERSHYKHYSCYDVI